MRMRKKPNLLPRMDACAALWIKKPTEYRGHWKTLMPHAKELRLELGCGKGRFTADTAAANPNILFVAVERVPDAMVIAMERCRAQGLANVFFIEGDAARLYDYFEEDEVDLIYINFCDPWPSLKHAKRRLTHEGFLRNYRRVLREGGQIHFKTDNRDLYEWSLFQFPKAGYELSEVTRDLHEHGVCGIMTDYEEKFHNLGTPINRCVGTKRMLEEIPVEEGLRLHLPGWRLQPLTWEDREALGKIVDRLSLLPVPGEAEEEKLMTAVLEENMPRAEANQKHVLGLWQEERLKAALEFVENYPREQALWLRFFTMDMESREQGLDRHIIQTFLSAAEQGGFGRVRLTCPLVQEEGHRFWEALGFCDLRLDKERKAIIMEYLKGKNRS